MDDHKRLWILVGGIAASLVLAGCSHHDDHSEHPHPAHVEHIDGSDLSRVTLTDAAMRRTDVRTTELVEEQVNGSVQKVVPYSSIIYDPHGKTWVYTSPEPNTFVRAPIDIDRIEGDRVLLHDGPPAGTQVASLGVAEIYGSEFEVGH
jgi:hypothetical protein